MAREEEKEENLICDEATTTTNSIQSKNDSSSIRSRWKDLIQVFKAIAPKR
jgi:hypothetical protein